MVMGERIQDLTDEELQETILQYEPLIEHNSIARVIVELYRKELNERTN
jgi:hypothetical protein